MLAQPPVLATSSNGIANATTNTSGQTAQVTVTANGATMANYWVNGVSVATTAAIFMLSVPAGQTCALQYTVATPIWYWSSLTPAMPTSTTVVTNTTGQNISVILLGGTVTVVAVNGVTVAATSNVNVLLPAGSTIAVTYSVAPVWAWMNFQYTPGQQPSNASAYMQENTIVPSGVSGYSELNALPYAQHAEAGQTGLGTGVSN